MSIPPANPIPSVETIHAIMPISRVNPRRFFWRRVFPAIAWAGVIFVLSSFPGPTVSRVISFPFADKWAHTLEYLILGVLILRAGRDAWFHRPHLFFWMALSQAIGVLYGVGDECHQAFVPDRVCSGADLVADAIGVAIGIAAWAWIARRRARGVGIRDATEDRRETT